MESIRKSLHAAVVIGGVNMDICGKPFIRTVRRDSNPGRISCSPGGVGRNIAHDLRLLGSEVSLIAAFGGDAMGNELLESCRELGIDTSMSLQLSSESSSCYMYISDERGDMLLAVSDMDITKRITPEHIAENIDRINSFDAAVLDANLEEETLLFAAEHIRIPVFADPVSAAKAQRLKKALPYLTALKPNLLEAQTLTGRVRAEDCARALVDMGVKKVFVSMGADGIIAAEGDRIIKLPAEACRTVNTTGAGDAAAAALVWAGMEGMKTEKAAALSMKAAALTCGSERANCPELADITKG